MSKLNRISVPSVEMPNYWFQSSRMNHSTDRWKHTQHKVTPIIHYLFRDDGYTNTASHFNGDEPGGTGIRQIEPVCLGVSKS
jgi:hypothetical protein